MEKERLIRQKLQLEEDPAHARQQAIELMNPGYDQPDKDEVLATVNRQAVDLSKKLTRASSRCKTYQGSGITDQDVSEAFANPPCHPAYAGSQTGHRPQALDGEIPEAAEPIQAAVIQALARAFSLGPQF